MTKRVTRGRYHRTIAVTATKRASHPLKFAKRMPSASTVPKSVTKHAAKMSLPISVRLRPVSTMVA